MNATVGTFARNVGLAICAALVMGVALPAAAQDLARMDVSIGYQGARSGDLVLTPYVPAAPANGTVVTLGSTHKGTYKYGFNADGSVPLNEVFSVVAELGWIRNSVNEVPAASHANFNSLNVGGGLRWNRAGDSMSIFAQAIVGLARNTFDTGSGNALGRFIGQGYVENSLMVQPGVGVVYPLTEAIGVLGQVDFRQVFSNDTQSMVRYVIGIRYTQR